MEERRGSEEEEELQSIEVELRPEKMPSPELCHVPNATAAGTEIHQSMLLSAPRPRPHVHFPPLVRASVRNLGYYRASSQDCAESTEPVLGQALNDCLRDCDQLHRAPRGGLRVSEDHGHHLPV